MANPQTWIFPPKSPDQTQNLPPPAVSAGYFGPVDIGDTVYLDWSPATALEIQIGCHPSAASSQTGGWLIWSVPLNLPPAPFKFTTPLSLGNAGDSIECHFHPKNSTGGDTIGFGFSNKAGSVAKTFGSLVYTSSSSSSSSKSTSITSRTLAASISSPTQSMSVTSSTQSAAPTNTGTGGLNGLSPGARAGMIVGVTLGVFIIAVLLFLIWLFVKRHREQGKPTGNKQESVQVIAPIEERTEPVELSSQPRWSRW